MLAAGLSLGLAACGTLVVSPDAVPMIEIFHVMGMIKIPASPKRVVVLDPDRLDNALALGHRPVGATSGETESPAIEEVGTVTKPDLQKIAELEPDLILGSAQRHVKLYPGLSRIAPTVFTDDTDAGWKDTFALDGLALGRQRKAQELLAAYEKRADEVGAAIPYADQRRISIVGFTADRVRIYGPGSFAGGVLHDVGLGRPERQLLADQADKRFAELDTDRIAEADGDFVFVAADSGEAAERVSVADWAALTAVRTGRSRIVPTETWITAASITAAGSILDDLADALR
jgi:iron complex transport system substrate-binding protein